MTIEPIFDSEDSVWFAGTRLGLPTGPWSQRGEFFAWPSRASQQGAEAYATKAECQIACDKLNRMTTEELRVLCPEFFEGEKNK